MPAFNNGAPVVSVVNVNVNCNPSTLGLKPPPKPVLKFGLFKRKINQ